MSATMNSPRMFRTSVVTPTERESVPLFEIETLDNQDQTVTISASPNVINHILAALPAAEHRMSITLTPEQLDMVIPHIMSLPSEITLPRRMASALHSLGNRLLKITHIFAGRADLRECATIANYTYDRNGNLIESKPESESNLVDR